MKRLTTNKTDRISYRITSDLFTIVFAFIGFWYLGRWIDERYAFGNVFQLGGIFLGLIATVIKLFALIKSVNETSKK